ncbi:hypothetical protein, partial [Stenotrophomonas sp.]|uniref:hypothetical protein n=1 Tax=Stenotrophomonas sp. TaxID=69392 RepID=UPI0028A9F9C8
VHPRMAWIYRDAMCRSWRVFIHAWRGSTGMRCADHGGCSSTHGVDLPGCDVPIMTGVHPRMAWIYWDAIADHGGCSSTHGVDLPGDAMRG